MSETRTIHINDADVLRHLDGEGDAAEAGAREAHLAACAACADRVRELGRASERVSRWLVRADEPVRPAPPPAWLTADRRPRRILAAGAASPWLRAAVIVLLLAAPLAALQPVRQWVAERVGLRDPAPEAALTGAPASGDLGTVRFTPAPGRFTVRIDAPAPGATLRLGRAPAAEAVLSGTGDLPTPPVVSADAVRLPAGEAAAGRAFALAVPTAVDEVVLLVADRSVAIAAPELDAGVVVDLGRGRSVNR